MTFRRRRLRAASYFQKPVPYDPRTGHHAPIGPPVVDMTRVQAFQVTGVGNDYVGCRGYDPEARRFYDGASYPIYVAKPYLLQKTPWHGRTVSYGDLWSTRCTYYYETDFGAGDYTYRHTTNLVTKQKFVERCPTYLPGEIILCAKVHAWVSDGTTTTNLGDAVPTRTSADTGVYWDTARSFVGQTVSGNAVAWADLNVAGRGWHIAPWAASIKFTLTEASTGSVHTVTVNDCGGGENPASHGGVSTTVKVDMRGMSADSGSTGCATLFGYQSSTGDPLYLLSWLTPVELTVPVYDASYGGLMEWDTMSSGSIRLKVKTRKLTVLRQVEDGSSPYTISCDLMSDAANSTPLLTNEMTYDPDLDKLSNPTKMINLPSWIGTSAGDTLLTEITPTPP